MLKIITVLKMRKLPPLLFKQLEVVLQDAHFVVLEILMVRVLELNPLTQL